MLDTVSEHRRPASSTAARARSDSRQLELDLFERSPTQANGNRAQTLFEAGGLHRAQAEPEAGSIAIEHPPLWTEKHSSGVKSSQEKRPGRLTNEHIAVALERLAGVVASKDGDTFRVRPYLDAAERVRHHRSAVAELLLLCGPRSLPEELVLGPHIVAVIEEIIYSSSPRLLYGLQKDGAPAKLPIGLLLALDARYRALGISGQLRRIAPRRFNPEHRAWLPLMHIEIRGWQVRVMYSNTERAHQLARVSDWVIIVAERDGQTARATVVTERYGVLRGRRVIRGREQACRDYYRQRPTPRATAPLA